MIAQIFENMHITLQRIVNYNKNPQRRIFRMAEEITKRLISNQIDYDFTYQNNIVYIEELDKDGKIVEVVALDLDTGEYTVVDLEKYLKEIYS